MITMVVIKTAINTVTIIIIIIIINVNQASLYCLHLVVVCIVTPLQHEIAVLANMLQIAPMHTVAIRQFVGPRYASVAFVCTTHSDLSRSSFNGLENTPATR